MSIENKNPSEVIQDFLELMKFCQTEYQDCIQEVWKHDKRVQDFLHEMEFAQNKQERNRIATRLHNSRVSRRKMKNRATRAEKVCEFYCDKSNKQFFDKLRKLLEKQKSEEQYLDGEKTYKPRVGETDDNSG